MAKAVKAQLTAAVLNWLFQKVAIFELPEKLGDTAYDFIQRRIVKDECASATRELKAYSYYAQKLGDEMRLVFGPKDLWEEARKDGKLTDLKMLHPEKTYEVQLGSDAISGISWMLLAMLSVSPKPALPAPNQVPPPPPSYEEASPIMADLYCWPIATAIRRVKILRESLNLDSSEKKRKWADDPDPEEEGEIGKLEGPKKNGEPEKVLEKV